MSISICIYEYAHSLTYKCSHILTDVSLTRWIHVCQYDTKVLQSNKLTFPHRDRIQAKLDFSAFYTVIPKCSYQYFYREKNGLN